ncbi:Uncharacterised protein [Mycobacteroides abscessus subsp. abscessus]|nr:Uncharacterised protein [Mycobacteroides abscessus subsp. abscessus]
MPANATTVQPIHITPNVSVQALHTANGARAH